MRAMVFAVMAISVLANPGPTLAQVEFYQEGNRLYQEGAFVDALASYLRLVEAGFESGEARLRCLPQAEEFLRKIAASAPRITTE